MNDHQVAGEVAEGAGRLLLSLREAEPDLPIDELREAGDRKSNDFIMDALAEHRPEDAVLSEEAADDPARLTADRVWIVDPLDGTREYGEGRTDWAVHVALVEDGRLAAGAVALPGLGLTLTTLRPPVVVDRGDGPVRILVSRTRPPAMAEWLCEQLDGVLVPMGSAGAKAMAVARGEADVYAHAGGQYEWDSAAPVAVAVAAGLHASRLDGSVLVYNQPDTWLPDLLISRSELSAEVLQILQSWSG